MARNVTKERRVGQPRCVSLVLPSTAEARLERLKVITETPTYAEVIRRALVLYERIEDIKKSGSTIQVKDSGGQVVALEII